MKKVILILALFVGLFLVGCNDTKDATIDVSHSRITIAVDETQEITVELDGVKGDPKVVFESEDAEIAEVSSNGVIKGLKGGTTNIKISVEGYEKLTATVRVTVEVDTTDHLSVTHPEKIFAGDKVTIEYVDKLDSPEGVIWVAQTPRIATIDSNTGEVTGVSEGIAKFQLHSVATGHFVEFEIEVVVPDVESIEVVGSTTSTKVKTTANYSLTADVYPKAANNEVIWHSNNDVVAQISEDGKVKINQFGVVTFTATSVENEEISGYITIEFYWDPMDLIDYLVVENPHVKLDAKGYGWEAAYQGYDTEIIGSVSNYYFGMYDEVEQIIPEGRENRPGITHTSTEFITVHDTATGSPAGNAQFHSNLVQNFSASWHYSIGNDGVFKQLPDNEVAYHAGDGSNRFGLNDTGVKAISNIKPVLEIDAQGYFRLNGIRTKILAPKSSIDGSILTTNDINDYGIYMEVGENGNWFMNNSWHNSREQRKISNAGGNRNSIGIETSMNYGSDLFLTWHYTAKKVSFLLLEHDLGLDRVVTHHYFSSKECPQTMRRNGFYEVFQELVEAEYLVHTFLSDYTITFTSQNPNLVDNTGRIIELPDTATEVNFLINVSNDSGFNQTRVYTSTIPGRLA